MLNYLLRLYLRHGARLTVKRLHRELGSVYDNADTQRYTGIAIDDFFLRATRFMRGHAPLDATKTLEEEKERAMRKYTSK